MGRQIIVFERWIGPRDERGHPELDFRLVRGALPCGSCPLAMAQDGTVLAAWSGQWFNEEEVRAYATKQSQ